MHDIEALDILLEKVKTGDVTSADSWIIHRAIGEWAGEHRSVRLVGAIMLETLEDVGSAIALLGALLPGWGWELHDTGTCTVFDRDNPGLHGIGNSDTPARAMLIAVLEGLKAKMQQEVV